MKNMKAKASDLPKQALTPSNDDASPIESLCLDVALATVRRKPAAGGQTLARQIGDDLAEMLARELARRLTEVAPAALVSTIADDLLEGADAIAAFLFGDSGDKRKVYHLVQSGALPSFRMGNTVCARKSTLLAWIKRQEEEQ